MIYFKTAEEIELSARMAGQRYAGRAGRARSRGSDDPRAGPDRRGLHPKPRSRSGISGVQRFPGHALHIGQRAGRARDSLFQVVLKDGDVVSVDCGTFMKGFYGDSAYTFAVGKIAPEAERLLRVTRKLFIKGSHRHSPIASATSGVCLCRSMPKGTVIP